MTALAGSSGSLHRSPAQGEGRDDAEPPFPIFTASGWTASDLAGVTAVGELDVATAPLLSAAVNSVCKLGTSEVREFLLDLQGVTFLDSIGLRATKHAEQAVTNWGWRVQVTQPTARGPRQLIILARRHETSSR